MPGLTKKKKRSYTKPFTGLTDRYGRANLQLGAENPSAIESHRLLKKPSRKRKGSMATEYEKSGGWKSILKNTSRKRKGSAETGLDKAMRSG